MTTLDRRTDTLRMVGWYAAEKLTIDPDWLHVKNKSHTKKEHMLKNYSLNWLKWE